MPAAAGSVQCSSLVGGAEKYTPDSSAGALRQPGSSEGAVEIPGAAGRGSGGSLERDRRLLGSWVG